MLKKALAPLFLTSIFVIAGCSSDEASKDLENAEDVEMNEEGQQPSDSNSTNEESISKSEGDNSQQDSSDQDSNENEDTEKSLNNSESSTDTSQESSSSENESTTDDQKSTQNSQGSGGSGGADESEGNQGSETSNSNESTKSSQQDQYTIKEVNGEAVNVLQGLNAVEIKRENISGATANTKVILKAGGKEIALTYNKKRDSFRNYQIKQVELDKLKEATVIVKG